MLASISGGRLTFAAERAARRQRAQEEAMVMMMKSVGIAPPSRLTK